MSFFHIFATHSPCSPRCDTGSPFAKTVSFPGTDEKALPELSTFTPTETQKSVMTCSPVNSVHCVRDVCLLHSHFPARPTVYKTTRRREGRMSG